MSSLLLDAAKNIKPSKKRSKLAPYLAEIIELLHNGYSYRQIANLLNDVYTLNTTCSKVHEYIKRHSTNSSAKQTKNIEPTQKPIVATQSHKTHQPKQDALDAFLSKRPQPIKSTQE